MKWLGTIIGVVLLLMGAVWFLQGLNLLPGSFMTGQLEWAVAGAAAVVAGLGLIFFTSRRPGGSPLEDESNPGDPPSS